MLNSFVEWLLSGNLKERNQFLADIQRFTFRSGSKPHSPTQSPSVHSGMSFSTASASDNLPEQFLAATQHSTTAAPSSPARRNLVIISSPTKKLRMRSRPHEVDRVPLQLVNQQEVAANVAFPVVGPVAFERVILPLSAKRAIVGDQEQHRLLELPHVVAPGAR